MWEALGALGIPQKFDSRVRALYRDATVNLYINGPFVAVIESQECEQATFSTASRIQTCE
jgi:hypothetical protein